jgi:hypothetical protein
LRTGRGTGRGAGREEDTGAGREDGAGRETGRGEAKREREGREREVRLDNKVGNNTPLLSLNCESLPATGNPNGVKTCAVVVPLSND